MEKTSVIKDLEVVFEKMKLEDLYSIIIKRRNKRPKDSYAASLIKKGEDAILQKIGEEATEVVLAAKGKGIGKGLLRKLPICIL